MYVIVQKTKTLIHLTDLRLRIYIPIILFDFNRLDSSENKEKRCIKDAARSFNGFMTPLLL
uniref:Uncharacterized protein n=1 Tax=Rhizophagus irregularis (strain DAOM 181602 / DAOM 197198 / MUCL 43194) TaxID=747089 RepID=U9T0A9_RHIID